MPPEVGQARVTSNLGEILLRAMGFQGVDRSTVGKCRVLHTWCIQLLVGTSEFIVKPDIFCSGMIICIHYKADEATGMRRQLLQASARCMHKRILFDDGIGRAGAMSFILSHVRDKFA